MRLGSTLFLICKNNTCNHLFMSRSYLSGNTFANSIYFMKMVNSKEINQVVIFKLDKEKFLYWYSLKTIFLQLILVICLKSPKAKRVFRRVNKL